MISQRLRGVKEDGEAIEEEGFIPKLQKAFSDVGVSIQDQNGELRSTFDILQDLAGVWDTLSSKQKQYLGEKAAGNRQVKTLNAIMANWDIVEDTIQKANEATGAATEGNEKYLDSIEGRITQFNSAFQDLARTTIDSGFVKGIVGGATDITRLVTKIGGLVPILTTISGIIITLKGVKIAEGIKNIGTAIAGLMSGLSGTGGLVGILTSLPGAIGAIVAVVGVVAAVTSAISNARKNLSEVATEKRQGYEDQKAKVEGLNEELKNTQSIMSDLSSKGSLTVVEKDEYDRLKETNSQLERQIELENARLKIAQREARESAALETREYNESTSTGSFINPRANTVSEGLLKTLGTEWFDKNLKSGHIATRLDSKELQQMKEVGAAYTPSVEELVKAHSEALLIEKQNLIKANEEYYRAIAESTDSEGNIDPEKLEYIEPFEEAKTRIEDYVHESESFLNDYLSYLEERTAGISKVENAIPGSLDAYYNSMIEERERISDVLLTSSIMDKSAGEQSDYILSKFSDEVSGIKDKIEENGKITADDLIDNASFNNLVSEFEKYGWELEDIVTHLNETFATDGEVAIKKYGASLSDVAATSFIATESYKNLTAAMSEQQKAGAISIETYQKLINDKEGLPGIAKCLTLTAEGYALNTEAAYDYIKAQNDEQKAMALMAYQEKTDAINELLASMQHYSKFGENVAGDAAMVEQLQREQEELAAYIHQLDSATGALARYKAAKQTANDDEDYTTGQSALKEIKEGWKSGKVGTDDYQEAMGFFLSDYGQGDLTGKNAQKQASKIGNRYFKDEKKGANTFISDLKKANLATEQDGRLVLNEGLTLDSVAEGLAGVYNGAEMSTDAVAALFKLLQTYSEDKFEWPEVITSEEEEEIEKRKAAIKELEDTETKAKEKVSELQNQIDNAGEGEDTSALEAQRDELLKSIEELETKKEGLENGEPLEVDAESMTLQDAIDRLNTLQDLVNSLNTNGVDIPTTVKDEAEQTLGVVNDKVDELQGKPPTELSVKADDQTETGVQSAIDSVNGIEQPKPVQLTATDKISVKAILAAFNLGLIPKEKATELLAHYGMNEGIDQAKNALEGLPNEKTVPIKANNLVALGLLAASRMLNAVKEHTVDIKAENLTGEGIQSALTSFANNFGEDNPVTATIQAALDGTQALVQSQLDAIADKKRIAWIEAKVGTPEGKSSTEVENDLVSYEETYQELKNNTDALGKYMQNLFGNGSVDLLNRKSIPSSMLGDVGWTDEDGNPINDDSYATLFSSDIRLGENGEYGVIITPITPDGDPLEPDSFEEYINGLTLNDDGTINPESDPLGLVASQFDLSSIPEELRDSYMKHMADLLHRMQEDFYGGDPELEDPGAFVFPQDKQNTEGKGIEVSANIEEGSGGKIVEELQQEVDGEPPIELPAPEESDTTDTGGYTISVEPESGSGENIVEDVQKQVDSEKPVQVETEAKPSPVTPPTPSPSSTPSPNPTPTPAPSHGDIPTLTQTVVEQIDDGAVKSYKPGKKKMDVEADLDTREVDRWQPQDKTATVKYTVSGPTPGEFATGTKSAPAGPSLVDEKGAELIEHVNRGTYELGTNQGARMTYLDKGDVVHTAKETKSILSRLAKVGGFFRDGLNKGKSIIGNAFAQGIGGSISLSNIRRVTKSVRSNVNGNNNSNSNTSKSKSKSKKNGQKAFQKWAAKLFDWAEIRLERLKTVTNSWLLSAADAIGYVAKNTELTGAIQSVQKEIDATSKAYDLYLNQAKTVQKKGKLSDAIVKKIQQGNISIGKYNKATQEKIKEYQKWYEKAMDCSDALNDLREQEKELAKQRLDNIIQHFTNRTTQLDNVVRLRESIIDLMNAEGKELFSKDYDKSIDATTKKLSYLVEEEKALKEEMEYLIGEDLIVEGSDDWYDYQSKIQDVGNEIEKTKKSIIDLQDTVNEIKLIKLGWQLDAITNSASRMSDMMNLHSVQGIEEEADAYADLIENGMDQIKNLEEQNEEYRKQQEGLDVLSEKYQELEQKIQSNISAINSMKVSQEGWNDSVLDLKISQLEQYRDSLSKMNDQYQRQKELQEAIEELQRVQNQRTQKVFKEGIGFVFEADQDALKDAQENLENVIEDQLLSKIDDLIDALEEMKFDTNIYDAEGNLLGTPYQIPQLGTLTDILENYYNSNVVPNFSGLKGSLYDQIVAGTTNNQSTQINFGDINLSNINDVETLGAAIVDLLPNAILQAINKKP